MIFLPTTHFKVVERTQDFPLDFQITHRADYIVMISNSNNETYSISPLVVEHRLRQGRIQVIAFPAHPSHRMDQFTPTGVDGPLLPLTQCSQCMIRINEEQIQFECALPAREILGPDSFGGSDYPHSGELRIHDGTEHPWIKRGPGPLPRTTAMPIPDIDTVCPACILSNEGKAAVVRLCVAHQNCKTCGNPLVILCPNCLEPKA